MDPDEHPTFRRLKKKIMAQDPQAQAIRRRKAAIKLAKWKEAAEAAPAKAAPKKKAAKKA